MDRAAQLLELVKKTEKTLKNYQQYYKWLLDELAKVDEDTFHEYMMEKEMRFKE